MNRIVPKQKYFPSPKPEKRGNHEYRQQYQTLMIVDQAIEAAHLETPLVKHFLKLAREKKAFQALKTGCSPRLSANEHDNAVYDAVFALRASVLRKEMGCSLRSFALYLSMSDLYQWFCGLERFHTPNIPGKSKIHELENLIPPALLNDIEQRLMSTLKGDEILLEPIGFDECYFDCTCIEVNIHHPIDWLLLRDATRTLMKATKRIRKAGLTNRMPKEPGLFISEMNNLCIKMANCKRQKNAGKKRKATLREMKQLVKKVVKHADKHLELLLEKWQQTGMTLPWVRQIAKQMTNVLDQVDQAVHNAHERIIGQRKVKNNDKILSLYEPDVNVIVRKKAGKEVEFGNTLYLAEQAEGFIVDWLLFRGQAPADSKMIKGSIERIEQLTGTTPKLGVGDRGFDSKKNREYFEKHHIHNGICPKAPAMLQERSEDEVFKLAQKRRSQTEARIGIIKNCFCNTPVLQRGFDNRETHMGLSILSHNLFKAARLRMAQEQALEETDAA